MSVEEEELVKCCPECRLFSEMVVPSYRFLTGFNKNLLLEKFRSKPSLKSKCIVNVQSHPINQIRESGRERERQRNWEREYEEEQEREWERAQRERERERERERDRERQPSFISQTLTVVGYVSACVFLIHVLTKK